MELNYKVLDEIAAEYGDSFYIVNSDVFRENYEEMLSAFTEVYPNTRIAYSYKTNYIPKLCKIVKDVGGAAEIVSEMELWLAEKIGVSRTDIYYNGPYKKAQFIESLLFQGGHINIDADYEAEIIENIARQHPDMEFQIGVRCNVDIGQEVPSRFGFDVASGALENAMKRLNQISNVRVNGLHCHIPFRTLDSYKKRMEALFKILNMFPQYEWDYISLGGGYMGKVDDRMAEQLSYNPPTFSEYASIIAGGMRDYFADSAKHPTLIIEPGSALAANAMKYVMRVIDIKKVRDKQIANLSGSSYQINPSVKDINRPITIHHAEGIGEPKEYECLDMAGYTCIESDYLYKNYSGKLAKGDFVVLDNVGSYSVVMKPPFILPDIPVLELHKEGQVELVKRAQTAEDVFMYYN
ncbi:MAG: decarboxylase [Bacillota bacterium]|nr:decarboxylase [Bacillota bacterium]